MNVVSPTLSGSIYALILRVADFAFSRCHVHSVVRAQNLCGGLHSGPELAAASQRALLVFLASGCCCERASDGERAETPLAEAPLNDRLTGRPHALAVPIDVDFDGNTSRCPVFPDIHVARSARAKDFDMRRSRYVFFAHQFLY